MYKRVIITGSLAYDHIMNIPSSFTEQIQPNKLHALNVSFVFDKFRKDFGGSGGNIAYTLNHFQIPSELISCAGNDFDEYQTHLDKLSFIHTSHLKIYKSTHTATGFVMTDTDSNQIWGFYEGAMKHSPKIDLSKILREGDLLVIAPNDPIAMIKYYKDAVEAGVDYIFDPSFVIPNIPTLHLVEACKNAKVVFGNDFEVSQLLEKMGYTLTDLLSEISVVVTTLGSNGSAVCTKEKIHKIKAARPNSIVASTGAGINYRAGFIAGFFHGFSPHVCGEMGSIAAAFTLERLGSQTHNYSINQFKKRYKKTYNKDLNL